jgi:hypothetical protein
MIVHHDLVQWQSGDFRRRRLDPRNGLIADPYFAAVLADMSGAVHRLHRGVREKRNQVGRLDLGDGACHRLVGVADGLCHRPRFERRFFELVHNRCRVELGVRTVVPFDLERCEAFLCSSHVISDDRNGVLEPHDLTHALDGLGCRIIHVLHAAAENR